ncbi:hypothetical protein AVEN_116851-1 [Araneus ventricosus]|uniref:Uncharacterized protein n=1 Tax=Araneus ventricosus TaxID=182803 RepID=A0A4Y2SKE0_ARAVE|nr:hypothetical protein AVEN_116851-1 [Araneus ventricosus]
MSHSIGNVDKPTSRSWNMVDRRHILLFSQARGMAESAETDPLQEIMDEYWKNKEGKPPTEGDLEMCAKIQDIVEKKIYTRKYLRRARKRLKKAPPDSEAAKKSY